MLYSTNNTNAGSKQNLAAAFKTLVGLYAVTATLTPARVYDVLFGTDGTPADNAMDYDISRITTSGTSTASIPNPLDSATRAAGTAALVNATVEPTYTASSSLFAIGVNQRASYRWVAAPGSELVIPATNLNGVGFRASSPGYTSTAVATLMHSE